MWSQRAGVVLDYNPELLGKQILRAGVQSELQSFILSKNVTDIQAGQSDLHSGSGEEELHSQHSDYDALLQEALDIDRTHAARRIEAWGTPEKAVNTTQSPLTKPRSDTARLNLSAKLGNSDDVVTNTCMEDKSDDLNGIAPLPLDTASESSASPLKDDMRNVKGLNLFHPSCESVPSSFNAQNSFNSPPATSMNATAPLNSETTPVNSPIIPFDELPVGAAATVMPQTIQPVPKEPQITDTAKSTNTKAPVIKRPFLKKGSGLARYRSKSSQEAPIKATPPQIDNKPILARKIASKSPLSAPNSTNRPPVRPSSSDHQELSEPQVQTSDVRSINRPEDLSANVKSRNKSITDETDDRNKAPHIYVSSKVDCISDHNKALISVNGDAETDSNKQSVVEASLQVGRNFPTASSKAYTKPYSPTKFDKSATELNEFEILERYALQNASFSSNVSTVQRVMLKEAQQKKNTELGNFVEKSSLSLPEEPEDEFATGNQGIDSDKIQRLASQLEDELEKIEKGVVDYSTESDSDAYSDADTDLESVSHDEGPEEFPDYIVRKVAVKRNSGHDREHNLDNSIPHKVTEALKQNLEEKVDNTKSTALVTELTTPTAVSGSITERYAQLLRKIALVKEGIGTQVEQTSAAEAQDSQPKFADESTWAHDDTLQSNEPDTTLDLTMTEREDVVVIPLNSSTPSNHRINLPTEKDANGLADKVNEIVTKKLDNKTSKPKIILPDPIENVVSVPPAKAIPLTNSCDPANIDNLKNIATKPRGEGEAHYLLRQKIAELDLEIVRFREENSKVKKLRTQLEQEIKEAKHVKEKAESELSDERNKFEEYKRDEIAKLAKERRLFDDYRKAQRSALERKDRDEIEQLKNKIEETEALTRQKDARNHSTFTRLRERISSLEQQNGKLKEDVERLEQIRMDLLLKNPPTTKIPKPKLRPPKQKFSPLPEVLYSEETDHVKASRDIDVISSPVKNTTETRSKSKKGVQSNINGLNDSGQSSSKTSKNSSPSVSIASPTKSLSMSPPRLADSKSNDAVIEAAVSSVVAEEKIPLTGEFRETKQPDGKIERAYADGASEIIFPNGTKKRVSASGDYSVVSFFNGDVKQCFPDGRVLYYYTATRTSHCTMPDGTEIVQFPSGQTEKYHLNGTKEILLPDQSVKFIHSDGVEETLYADGTAVKSASNIKEIRFPNGQREIHTADYKKREYPDGTTKTVYSDGRQETRYANGRTRVKDASGTVIVDSSIEKSPVAT